MPSTALFVHVPVDTITITNGPRGAEIGAIAGKLMINNFGDITRKKSPTNTSVSMTMKTSASTRSFRGKIALLKLECLDCQFEVWSFTGIFCGQRVRGVYDTVLRTGEFDISSC